MQFIKENNKFKLYYDKYSHKLTLNIPGIHFFRDIVQNNKSDSLFLLVDRRVKHIIATLNFTVFKSSNNIVKLKNSQNDILKIIQCLRKIRNEPLNLATRIQNNKISIYSNDIKFLIDLANDFKDSEPVGLCVNTLSCEYDKDKLYHINPKHKFRIVLRDYANLKISELYKFVNTYECYPCRSLKRLIDSAHNKSGHNNGTIYLYRKNSIDVDNEEYITLFALYFPKLIQKVLTIEQR